MYFTNVTIKHLLSLHHNLLRERTPWRDMKPLNQLLLVMKSHHTEISLTICTTKNKIMLIDDMVALCRHILICLNFPELHI